MDLNIRRIAKDFRISAKKEIRTAFTKPLRLFSFNLYELPSFREIVAQHFLFNVKTTNVN